MEILANFRGKLRHSATGSKRVGERSRGGSGYPACGLERSESEPRSKAAIPMESKFSRKQKERRGELRGEFRREEAWSAQVVAERCHKIKRADGILGDLRREEEAAEIERDEWPI